MATQLDLKSNRQAVTSTFAKKANKSEVEKQFLALDKDLGTLKQDFEASLVERCENFNTKLLALEGELTAKLVSSESGVIN